MSSRSYELRELLSCYDGINDLNNMENPLPFHSQPDRKESWLLRLRHLLAVIKKCPEYADLYTKQESIELIHQIFIQARCQTQHSERESSKLKLFNILDEERINLERQFITELEIKEIITSAANGDI